MTESEQRRNNWEVLKDILVAAKTGAIKTRMVYGANTNFKELKEYLAWAEEKGLLREIGGQWHTTEKGCKFILRVLDLQLIAGVGPNG